LDVVVSFGHRLINGLTRRVFVALSARLAPMISNHQKGLAGSIKAVERMPGSACGSRVPANAAGALPGIAHLERSTNHVAFPWENR